MMASRILKRFLQEAYTTIKWKEPGKRSSSVYGLLPRRGGSQYSGGEPQDDVVSKGPGRGGGSSSEEEEETNHSKWGLEMEWLTKAVEPALKLCWRTLPTAGSKPPPNSGMSVSEIIAILQRCKIGMEGWSLSDLTIGLYLIYLRQASLNTIEDVKGVRVSSELIVQDLMYHLELAKGCYKADTYALAKNTMLRERDIVKFVRNSSFMRPGYYISIDPRRKLVILAIRGTQTVYDLITDIVSSGGEEVNFDGYSTHFGTTEAARWFLSHELSTIRECLERYQGFRLRIVGHSLGGATASLLAIMLRKKSAKELGFNPEIVSAVGYATPPCVSGELAESCADFVTTTVMQDDIVPRLSVASLERLRNEIVQTDWMSVVEKQDWRKLAGLVTNAKQVVSSVQEVASKLADYARFRRSETSHLGVIRKEALTAPTPTVDEAVTPPTPTDGAGELTATTTKGRAASQNSVITGNEGDPPVPDELYVPGAVYYLKRDTDPGSSENDDQRMQFFTLWKRHPGEHFQRIALSSNIISDHKCDSHYYALRDVLKDIPCNTEDGLFGFE